MSILLGDKLVSITNVPSSKVTNLFDIKWSDYRLNDASWLCADSYSWHPGTSYFAAYNHLLEDWNNAQDNPGKVYLNANATLVGGLKDTEGIISEFKTNTAYITVPCETASTSFELVTKIHTPASFSAAGSIFDCITNYYGLIWRVTTSGASNIWISTNGTSWNVASTYDPSLAFQKDTDYWVKLSWDGTEYKFANSTDGITWVEGTSKASTEPVNWSLGNFCIGGTSRASNPWLSSIDITESYLNLNGLRYWTGGTFLNYYLAEDGHRICNADQDATVQALFEKQGVAWYYILDTVNTRFKLPRTKFGFTGLRDEVGKYVEAGLPDHNHTITQPVYWGSRNTYVAAHWTADDGIMGRDATAISSMASESNSMYSNSNTVQPPATQMYLYFYVGNFSKNALVNTAGITTEYINETIGKFYLQNVKPLADNTFNISFNAMEAAIYTVNYSATTPTITVSFNDDATVGSNKSITYELHITTDNLAVTPTWSGVDGWLTQVSGLEAHKTYIFLLRHQNGKVIGDIKGSY